MNFLQRASRNDTDVMLESMSGRLSLRVKEIDDDFFIKFDQKFIKVTNPNYECPNGVVHSIDDLLLTNVDLVKFGIKTNKGDSFLHQFWRLLAYNVKF